MELKEKVDRETAANEEAHKSFKRRLDSFENSEKERTNILLALQRQGDAIENMGKKVGEIAVSVGNVEKRVDEIEKEPADQAKKLAFEIVKYIVLAIVGVIVGYFIK
jgi:predicted Mrr-cat superfamily restriction endonuclease